MELRFFSRSKRKATFLGKSNPSLTIKVLILSLVWEMVRVRERERGLESDVNGDFCSCDFRV